LDGADLGPLPLHQQKNDVAEGDHTIQVKRGDKLLWERREHVVYAETTMVRAVSIAEEAPPVQRPFPVVPAVLGGAGAALIVGGAVCGTFSLLAARETEARAKEQQLLFPRDDGLLFRGRALAYGADALYLAGAATIAAGVVLFAVAE
jgi:hypothetical protein